MSAPGRMAAALLDPRLAAPDELRAWNGSDPTRRLAVHRNNVLSSLVDALADTFPVVQELVGEEFFRALAASFVRAAPPRTPILVHYGAEFADFVAGFPPAASVPYLSDVARLEWLRVQAYHAADTELISDEMVSLALASGERMGELRLVLHPSVHTLASPHAVVTLWAAHQVDGDDVAQVDVDALESALILRAGLEVLVLPSALGTVCFVEAVREGQNLGDAAARAITAAPDFDLSGTLTQLLAHGALSAIHLPPRLSS